MATELALTGGKPVVPVSQHVRWPVLGADDRAAVMAVLDRGVLSGPFAPEVRGLENEYAAYVGAKHAIATNSGTAALHVALAAAGIGPGDEVVTSAFSFVATALSVLHQSAIPVFVDVEPETFGLDPKLLEAAITPRTKAILPVHIHGTPCDLGPILAIAKKRGIPVIEDAAQAHGSTIDGKKVGTFGAAGCFSLQSSKSLACGEGGILVTSDDALADRARRTRAFGEEMRLADEAGYRIDRALDADRAYDSLAMGWMYRTNELSAAIGRTQLKKLDGFNARARDNAARLGTALAKLPGITPPYVRPGCESAFHKFRVQFDARAVGVDAPPRRVRQALLKALRAEGVDAVLWQTQPVPGQVLFRDKVGFGNGVPWSQGAPVDYDLARFPVTNELLDGSVVLFSQTYPIAPQPGSLCDAYAEAFAKVWGQLDAVLAAVPERA